MGTNCIKPVGFVLTDTGLHSVACKMRNCPVCSVILRLQLMERVKHFFSDDEQLRFMTLTKSINDNADIMTHWHTLMVDLKRKFPGLKGFWVKEYTKRGKAHLHMIVNRYIPQEWLSERWYEITRTSYIVHIEAMSDIKNPAAYMLKYMTKAMQANYQKGERIYGFFRCQGTAKKPNAPLRGRGHLLHTRPALEQRFEVLARLRRQQGQGARRLLHQNAKACGRRCYRVLRDTHHGGPIP